MHEPQIDDHHTTSPADSDVSQRSAELESGQSMALQERISAEQIALSPTLQPSAAVEQTHKKTPDNVQPKSASRPQKSKKKRRPKRDALEQRLLGRRAMCKRIEGIAPGMLKTVKLRILGRYLDSTRGMNNEALTGSIKKNAQKLASKKRVLEAVQHIDPDVNRRNLKEIMINTILLEEETYSLEESRLAEKVLEYERTLVKQAKTLSFFDKKKQDLLRWHAYDTYRIVLDAAWRTESDVSTDEAALLRVLRGRLNISTEEHRLIGAYLKRFPKEECTLHTRDEIHDARKELQREGLLWSYRDDDNQNIDVIPYEVAAILRRDVVGIELQRTNYCRLLHHDDVRLVDLRQCLESRDMDRYGNKEILIERIVDSAIRPTDFLCDLERAKVSEMCRSVGIKSSGNKAELIERLVEFYDDLTFEERETKDNREIWYNNYELLAARAYADLRAKKIISKDLDIEHQFEQATDFLFETKLHVKLDRRRKVTKADGRIPLENSEVILWDCKSVEDAVNLQDHMDDQFGSYVRREREKGNRPLAFFVIGPSFTSQSIKLAHQYKARTHVDVALIEAAALKYLAERWDASEPKNSFPIRLLNRTEVIDREKVDFLLSLA